MRKRSWVIGIILAGTAYAGLLWASQSLAEWVRRPSATSVRASANAPTDMRAGGRTAFALRPMLERRPSSVRATDSLAAPSSATAYGAAQTGGPPLASANPGQAFYALSAPVFFSDPKALTADSIAVGDVSGDGRDDLVFLIWRNAPIPTDSRKEIYVAYQGTNGVLQAAVRIADTGNHLSVQLLTADLDKDGRSDIITATADSVMLIHANADGSFTPTTVMVGDPYEITVTDVDRDGHLDVLVDASNTYATVIHGDGLGGVDHVSQLPLPSAAVRTMGDVTGDGLEDLILATIYGRPLQEIQVYPALASGGFGAPQSLFPRSSMNQTESLAVGDFNGDGRNDLVLDESRDHANLQVYFQDAQGNLVQGSDMARRPAGGFLIADDLNRDGRTDLAIAHTAWGYVGFYLQTDIGLAAEKTVDAYNYMGRYDYFDTGDLNNDGCGDLVLARSASQSPVLLYGQCVPVPIADCNLPALKGNGVPSAGLAPLVRRQTEDSIDSPRPGLRRGDAASLAREANR